MSSTMILVDRDVFFDELRTVFDVQTTETLLRVLDRVAKQVLAVSVPREDFSDLKRTVAELAEMHKESERCWKETRVSLSKFSEELRQLVEESRQSRRIQEEMQAAAGEELTEGADVEARAQGVVIVQNGRNLFWNEALTRLSMP